MGEWKEYRLSDFVDINPTVKIPKGIPVSYVEMKDLDSMNKYCTYSQMKELGGGSRFNDGDTLFARITPCLENGKICKVRELKNGYGFGSTEFHVFRSKDGLSDSDFFYYLSRSEDVRAHAEHNLEGSSGRQRVAKEAFDNLVLMLPPLDEQKRIAGVLSSLDDKIDLLHRENAILEALAETLFRHYFIENPDPEWKEGNIADVVDFNPARKLGKGENAPYVEMANVGTNDYAPSTWRIRPFQSGTKFINGDALMARISPCLENGKAAFVDFLEMEQVGWGSTEFIVMRSKLGIHPFFVYVLSKYDDFRDHAVSSLVGSSGRQRVDLDNLIKYPFIIPDKQAIELFNHELNTIFPKIQNNQKQIHTLTAQRDTLLSRLMNGEVNVV